MCRAKRDRGHVDMVTRGHGEIATFRVAGGGPRWRLAGAVRGATASRPSVRGGRVADASLPMAGMQNSRGDRTTDDGSGFIHSVLCAVIDSALLGLIIL